MPAPLSSSGSSHSRLTDGDRRRYRVLERRATRVVREVGELRAAHWEKNVLDTNTGVDM